MVITRMKNRIEANTPKLLRDGFLGVRIYQIPIYESPEIIIYTVCAVTKSPNWQIAVVELSDGKIDGNDEDEL